MRHLWAPWRTEYINKKRPSGCFLCSARRQRRDAENLILHRGKKAFVIMNRFPYNNGHLMIAPLRHVGDIERLTPDERKELLDLLSRTITILKRELKPQGFNVGVNLGKVSGAGLADHLHLHVVPRWQGDTNFMPVTGQTKVVSEALAVTYRRIRRRF